MRLATDSLSSHQATPGRFRVAGVSDAQNFCMCCGRTGLARVVFVEDTSTGEVKHFGTTCALAPAKGFALDREVAKAVVAWQNVVHVRGLAARTEYMRRGGRFHGPDAFGAFRATDKELMAECLVNARHVTEDDGQLLAA